MEQEALTITTITVGTLTALSIFLRNLLIKISIPAIIGYIAIGLVTKWLDSSYHFLDEQNIHPIEFLSEIGIILLLFRVGLESNIDNLLEQFPHALWIWFWNVSISGLAGFVTSFYILNIDIIPSLFIATAMTATSIGVSVALWKEKGMLESKRGQLMLDVAQLDDLSSVAILALLLAVVPFFKNDLNSLSPSIMIVIIAKFAATLIGFTVLCIIFSKKIIPHIKLLKKGNSDSIIFVISISFIIASLASILGLSIAIGAFFAGLIFSRNSSIIKCQTCYISLCDFFIPFFFIGIGLKIDLALLPGFFTMGLILLIAAIVGKVIGTGMAAIRYMGLSGATIMGISMVPRAEIAMVVMKEGLSLGQWAVSKEIFGAMSIVTIGTVIITAFGLNWMVKRDRDLKV
jgi:Kef-type K+ transport system membrane component KefB